MSFQHLDDLIAKITPAMHQDLRRAIELGRFPDGRLLTPEQRADLLQTVIAWETKNLPEHERSGYLPSKNCSEAKSKAAQPGGTVGIYDPSKLN